MGLGLNGALINWAIQAAFTIPTSFHHLENSLELFNPILLEKKSAPLIDKINDLKVEISSIKKKNY